jgi:hypothetical protein
MSEELSLNLPAIKDQKQKELEALNKENSRIEQYRLEIMSQIIRVNGQLELLQQLIQAQIPPKPAVEEPAQTPSA